MTNRSPTPAAQASAAAIYAVVGSVPRGRVITYGEAARLAFIPSGHRVVARAMRGCPRGLPWWRVLGKRDARRAHIVIADPQLAAEQRARLRREGVTVDDDGCVRLRDHGWLPRD